MENLKHYQSRNIDETKAQEKIETVFQALDSKKEKKDILADFTPEQKKEILYKKRVLSSLAYFIGRDFHIPVELNDPGAGWHWDFQNNVIRIDPKDLLEKPMDYLRFVISHEGGHRRISRTDFIPPEEWRQSGFSFMMNAVEDPRDNNFVAENYPKFKEQMDLAYQQDLDFEAKAKEQATQKLGYQPRFMRAGFEYIKQWFRETQGKEIELSSDLPSEVRTVVLATIAAARDSWWRYPSRQEADTGGTIHQKKVDGEAIIKEYAKVSYEINRDEIWPEFKKLVDADMQDQNIQELLKEIQKNQQKQNSEGGGGQVELPQNMKENMTPQEQHDLKEAIHKAIEEAKKEQEKQHEENKDSQTAKQQKAEKDPQGKPVDAQNFSEELKQKIKEYIDLLPKEEQRELSQKAKEVFEEFEKSLNEELRGKLTKNPGIKDNPKTESHVPLEKKESETEWTQKEKDRRAHEISARKRMEELFEGGEEKDPYREALERVSELIDALTADLREVFVKRKIEKHESGYRSGRRWNVRQRIREKIAGIPLFKTEAREQKTSESEEMDYAITMLIDLSGSMQGKKIEETFKSAIILAETLANLGIQFEVVGFQDILLEFKTFEERLTDAMRKKMNQILLEVSNDNPGGHNNCGDNDDGACLLGASKHLADQIAKNKFLIVLSDGVPAMDSRKKSAEQLDRELHEAVQEITLNTNQKLVGIGLMSRAVSNYYENHLANVSTQEMVETLGGLLREIIEKY